MLVKLDTLLRGTYRSGPDTVDAVVFEEVRQSGGLSQVVDGDPFRSAPLLSAARKNRRPMRPNPLIPTVVLMMLVSC